MEAFLNRLQDILKQEQILTQEPMKLHTTFKVGGPVDVFVKPESVEQIKEVMKAANEFQIPVYIIGNGSNLLVGDKGYRGVIIQIYKNMNQIQCQGNEITAQAGALLSTIAKLALEQELGGFEFASGIPGTLGGAVTMNAGAYGGEMKQVLKSAVILTKEGEVKTLTTEELKLGYRKSIIIDEDYIVLEAVIELTPDAKEEIQEKMNEYALARRTKQPLEYPSAGSTFKRPTGYFAGKLIDDAGLRGFSYGGAQVSEKHCGFVINKGDATAKDIVTLMKMVNEKVMNQFGVSLEPEVKMIGDFTE
ncbi:MAG: UDP-N-acetylmuramate dehydrogenase [Lachnospiraceae bacterium]|nr:UDP-N-acetylmuramate dehydrogenase [Lachnospiraceae bacterium]